MTQGGLATGNRVYALDNVTGTQFFKIYTVPEPSTWVLLGLATLCALVLHHRRRVQTHREIRQAQDS